MVTVLTKPAVVEIDAMGLTHKQMNARLREVVAGGAERIELHNVFGQKYIGTDLNRPVEIHIHGTPGGNLGSFMKGPRITVYGNAQDGTGNTMDSGEIVVHGHAGDITGLAARGGKVFIRDYVGYRTGIHMKEYGAKKPIVVVGGTAQDFLGEYMAGGVLVVLGLDLKEGETHKANFIGTGMHGGVIYLRGKVNDYQLGKEVGVAELNDIDWAILRPLVEEYAAHFGLNAEEIIGRGEFSKLYALSLRPYGRLYAY
ncbi:MAG: hypothetical protein FJZ95_04830 [Chloroflexi bacterium]|nr:hypothetical protein [Chloroflexota bacterium]